MFLGLLVFIPLFFGEMLYGQVSKLKIDANLGLMQTSLRGNEILERNFIPKYGNILGIELQCHGTKFLSYTAGVFLEKKGGKSKGSYILRDSTGYPLNTGNYTIYMKFSYLTIPLSVKASIGNKTKYYISTGPYIGILLKEKTIVDDTYSSIKESIETNNFRTLDFGITSNIGILTSLKGRFQFVFNIRNSLGCFNISKLSVINDGSIKTNSIGAMIGISYLLYDNKSSK